MDNNYNNENNSNNNLFGNESQFSAYNYYTGPGNNGNNGGYGSPSPRKPKKGGAGKVIALVLAGALFVQEPAQAAYMLEQSLQAVFRIIRQNLRLRYRSSHLIQIRKYQLLSQTAAQTPQLMYLMYPVSLKMLCLPL
ncbi:MAG: hypothetical protein J6Z02_05995 [Lachnospiraceae bacterium]|nr:hypothetical protein [Lachnospiraceae bacterium]